MASLIGSLYVSLTADFGQYRRGMLAAEATTATAAGGIRRSMGLTERSITGVQRSMRSNFRPYSLIAAARTFDTVQARANLLRGSIFALTGVFGGLGAAIATNVFSRYLDTFTGLENQIRVVSTGAANLTAQIGAVADVATRARSSLAATATLYSRLAKAAPQEGAVNLLRRVETINKALQLGGATAQESASAAIQFSQAIASNRLGGEELRAVLETPLGLELAKGLGVTIGKLREMGYAGELTAERLFGALDKVAGSVDAKFAQSVKTIDQAITVADSALTLYIGKVDDAYGVTKLLTAAISGFGNNVGTILPLVGQLGLAAAAAFSGRIAGSFLSKRINAVKQETAARRENLAAAREEAAAADKVLAKRQAEANAAAQIPKGGFGSLADRGLVKNLEREQAELDKIDQDRLKNTAQQEAARRKLASISVATTKAEIRAAESLASSETRLNELLGKRNEIYNQRARTARSIARLETASGGKDKDAARAARDLTKEQARQAKISQDLANINTRIATQRETIVARSLRITQLQGAAQTQAAEEQIAARRRLISLDQEAARIDESRERVRTRIFTAQSRIDTSGQAALVARTRDATGALDQAGRASERMARNLLTARNAATVTATGVAFLRAGAASLVGFLGGPWGVAFTAAIGFLTYFGIQSRKTAEQVARSQQVINEELDKLGQGGTDRLAPTEQITLLDREIEAQKQRLNDAKADLARIAEEIRENVFDRLSQGSNLDWEGLRTLGAAIQELKTQFVDGNITIDEFYDAVARLAGGEKNIVGLRRGMEENEKAASKVQLVINAISNALARLDGQKARVQVIVDVADPYGAFSLVGPGNRATSPRQETEQRNSFSSARAIARKEELRQAEIQAELRRAAGDKGQERSDRAQKLLEDGLAKTRVEADQLAGRLIGLENSTKAAGKASKSAAKDYENFANKIKELTEQASAAFLNETDRKVVDFAKSLKDGSKLMAEYIAAVEAGDLSGVDQRLLKVRDAIKEIGAAETWRDVIRQYGTGADLADQFAEKQEQLNYLVSEGRLTAEQAGAAYADFLSQFGQYQWVNQLTDAFVNFAETVLTDFDNIGDAAKSLLKEIGKIILQLTVLEPLRNALKGAFSGFGGGGGGGGLLGGALIPGILHEGGMAGSHQRSRRVPAASFIGAPRFHNGFGPRELPAILEEGEAVLSRKQTASAANTIAGLTSRIGGEGGRSVVELRLSRDVEARILEQSMHQSVQISTGAVAQYDGNMPGRVRGIQKDRRAY